ncbi:MAG TPA: BON domain-containing protein [Coleofasciculaceae cyanobacterium]
MKNLTTFVLSGILLLGAAACSDGAKTSADAPNSAESPAGQTTTQAPDTETVKERQEDAQDETRRKQLNSDIRAREERNNALNNGSAENRDDDNLASEVRSKLEANIPNGALTVDAEEGAVIIAGTVPKQEQIAKIEPLAKQIKGVKSVTVKATVAPPTAKDNNEKSQ